MKAKTRGLEEQSVDRFQKIAAILLQKHYGLGLNDTHLYDENIVSQCIQQGFRPYQVIAEHANEADLDRIDLDAGYGVPSKAEITVVDENAAIAMLEAKESVII
jgi:cytoskeleton-binding toxin CbtA-like protein